MRLLLHFARFGPYHHTRLRAVAAALAPEGWEVIGLETASKDITYAWDEVRAEEMYGTTAIGLRTLFPGRVYEEITPVECRRGLYEALEELAPDAVAVAGWGTVDARLSLRWCRKRGVKAIVMSETREADGRRIWWKEKVKSMIMRHAHGAIVGGRSHRDYLVKLGIPRERIQFGYNVVDNAYFGAGRAGGASAEGSGQLAEGSGPLAVGGGPLAVGGVEGGTPMFLAANRFVGRKNLDRLLAAYALYCQSYSAYRQPPSGEAAPPAAHRQPPTADCQPPTGEAAPPTGEAAPPTANCQPPTAHGPWSLCLLGDGPLRERLIAQCHELGLNVIEFAPWEISQPLTAGSPLLSAEGAPPTADRPPSTGEAATPSVYFPGFRQIEELPRFYAAAAAFIHPAFEEPWGLVINEAMAAGLPVLSGSNVGAAEELIEEGETGWTFDATDLGAMASAMTRLASLPVADRLAMGARAADLLEERCPTRAFGQGIRNLLTVHG